MTKLDLAGAIQAQQRQILIDLLRQNRELTLGDLHQLARGELAKLFTTVTLEDLLRGAPSAASAVADRPGRQPAAKAGAKAGATAGKPAAAPKPAKANVDTRSAKGREAFEQSVLETLKALGGSASGSELRSRVGGTIMQVRAAANRLIEAGSVTWTGKARGTRYHLA